MSWRVWLPSTSAAQAAALLFGAITNILYARFLGASGIGALALLYSLAALIVLVADAGMQFFLPRELAIRAIGIPAALAAFLRGQPVLILLAWAVAAGARELIQPLQDLLPFGPNGSLLLLELALSLWLFQVALAMQQGLTLYARRAISVLANAVLTTALTAAALTADSSLAAAVQATAIAYLAVGVAALLPLAVRHGIGGGGFRRLLRLMMRSRALWANSVLSFATNTGDVLLAGLFLPLSTVGYYQVAKKLAAAILGPITALLPLFYTELSKLTVAARTRMYRRIQRGVTHALAGVTLAVAALLPPFVSAAYGSSFGDHSYLVIVLIGVGGLQFSHNLLGYVMSSSGLFARSLTLNAAATAGTIACVCIFAPALGLGGFAGAFWGANAAAVLLGMRLSAPVAIHKSLPTAIVSIAALAISGALAFGLEALPAAIGIPLGLVLGTAVAVRLALVELGPRHSRTPDEEAVAA